LRSLHRSDSGRATTAVAQRRGWVRSMLHPGLAALAPPKKRIVDSSSVVGPQPCMSYAHLIPGLLKTPSYLITDTSSCQPKDPRSAWPLLSRSFQTHQFQRGQGHANFIGRNKICYSLPVSNESDSGRLQRGLYAMAGCKANYCEPQPVRIRWLHGKPHPGRQPQDTEILSIPPA